MIRATIRRKKNQVTIPSEAGFTLVEILVSIAILSIIIVATTSVFITVMQSAEKSTIQEKLRYEGLRMLDQIGREVRDAKSVEASDISGSALIRISLDAQGAECIQYTHYIDPDVNGYITRCTGTCANLAAVSYDPTACPKFSDDSVSSGIDIKAVSYSVVSPSNRPKDVYITMTLANNVLIASRKSNIAEVTVKKTVSLRSY